MWFYSKLEKKVKRLMGERGDYKGWYYLPYHDMAAATGAEMTEDRTSMGRKGWYHRPHTVCAELFTFNQL